MHPEWEEKTKVTILEFWNSSCRGDPSRQVPPPPRTWREGPPASIPATEHRGITIAQLDTVVDALNKHADGEGFLPGWTDRYGNTCHKNTITLYPPFVRLR